MKARLGIALLMAALAGCGANGDGGGGGMGGTGGSGGGGSGGGGSGGGGGGGGSASPDPLPIDCDAPANAADPRCVRPSNMVTPVGKGPRPIMFPGQLYGGFGFLDGERLVVAVSAEGTSRSAVVLTIDLATGDRTVVSGNYEDTVTGRVNVGSGDDIALPRSVASGPDGWYVAAEVKPPVATPEMVRQLVRIDPKTGARKILESWGHQEAKLNTISCKYNQTALLVDATSLAVGPDGSTYLSAWWPYGAGIAAVKDHTCKLITYTTGNDATQQIGDGPTIVGAYSALRLLNGKIYALNSLSQSVIEVDVATGSRRRISSTSSSSPVGSGEPTARVGDSALALDGDNLMWTTGDNSSSGYADLVSIEKATGNRTAYKEFGGASANIWVHPHHKWIIYLSGGAFRLFDIANGNVNNLSF